MNSMNTEELLSLHTKYCRVDQAVFELISSIRDIDDDTFEDDTFLELSLSGIEETVIDRIKYLQDKV